MQHHCLTLAAAVLIAAPASATIVNVAADVTGCDASRCDGSHPAAGTVLASVTAPVQLVLDRGRYTITDATGAAGADPDLTAWSPDGTSWTWSYLIVDDATRTVLFDSSPASGIGGLPTKSDAASAAKKKNYVGHVTLIKQRTVDIVTEDGAPFDNAGGVSLDIERLAGPVPEPASWALLIAGFGGVGLRLRYRAHSAA